MSSEAESPAVALVEMARGYARGKVLCAAVRLGIADALWDGPKPLDELALKTHTDLDALRRLMRALAAIGVVAEVGPAGYALTPLGAPLSRAAPDSQWASMIFWADLLADFWTYLPDCVRSGAPAAAAIQKLGVKSRWSTEPDPSAIFHAVFAGPSASDMAAFAAAYDFSGCGCIADLGGAGGALLTAILTANPAARGILVDREQAIQGAAPRMAAAGLAARCELRAADLLEAVPQGADVYILKHVLHGYTDDAAATILKNCRAAMTPTGRLLIIEAVLPDQIDAPDPAIERLVTSDLNMLAVTGGRERTATEWRSLLSAAEFELLALTAYPKQDASLIEASPRIWKS